MIKAFAMVDSVLWILIIIALVAYIVALRRRMRGLNEPELWLPKKERQAHARKLLAREQDQWENQQLEQYNQLLKQPGSVDSAALQAAWQAGYVERGRDT